MTRPVSPESVAADLLAAEYKFARTLSFNPHWYTVRANWAGALDFEAVVQFIRDAGYDRQFKSKMYRCYDIDGMRYWTMGDTLPNTILINRTYNDRETAFVKGREALVERGLDTLALDKAYASYMTWLAERAEE